eukprot:ANDGO_01681.mRNA.1 hypothetical protein
MFRSRKHVTTAFLQTLPELSMSTEYVAQVVETRGNSMFYVSIAPHPASMSSCSTSENIQFALVKLPSKFHKAIWIRRGSFVIVNLDVSMAIEKGSAAAATTNANANANSNAISSSKHNSGPSNGIVWGEIVHIVDQKGIRHLKELGQWTFSETAVPEVVGDPDENEPSSASVAGDFLSHEGEDGEDEGEDDDNGDCEGKQEEVFVNRNRRRFVVYASDSEASDNEDTEFHS